MKCPPGLWIKIALSFLLGERPYQCKHCGKTFATTISLKTHTFIHTGEKPHRCPHCPKTFATSSKLGRHIVTHSEQRPFACSQCPKTFNRSGKWNVLFSDVLFPNDLSLNYIARENQTYHEIPFRDLYRILMLLCTVLYQYSSCTCTNTLYTCTCNGDIVLAITRHSAWRPSKHSMVSHFVNGRPRTA
jgi:DNA-directed RNA polymerase subunit RPC12/RpoP